ncbi:glycosyltransferase [bacterium]|nr:glycosyltransferase [bacterium]
MKKKIKKVLLKVTPNFVYKAYKNKKDNKKVSIYKHAARKKNIINSKKVSVVIPNYNYENYIEERIDSILMQTYPIHELIILDDCSTDNSVNKIEEIIKKHPDVNIKFVKNEKNSGSVFSQWQKAFSLSTGDYVWIAEADDSCSHYFLENVMKGFDSPNVVLSYAESMRIDENNKIISSSCRDWMLAVSSVKWNKSYINSGINEIQNALAICNTIPNVSAVVFKKSNQVEIIEEAKKFKISGDWYIYYKLLSNGDIAYCSKSLNYFRKHSKSTSTVVSRELEIRELLTIQSEIRKKCCLNSNQIHKQSFRYGGIINETSNEFKKEVSSMIAKKIAWIIPSPIKGSGGIRTMIQNANFLVRQGFECDIYVEEDYVNTNESMKQRIIDFYGECLCDVYVGIDFKKEYDLAFATYSIKTPDYLYYMKNNVKRKAYFIQDFEPWFKPMGGLYLDMEHTYKYGLNGVSIGKWLTYKLQHEFNQPMNYFSFCADTNVYKKLDNVEKENAICFIFQPEKPRRCSNIGIRALLLVKALRPDVKIYLYGSDVDIKLDVEMENLHIMPIDKCNELYNKCKVGVCMSSSNPSRIPFEMMAAGLPVVDLYRENNLYDIPEDGVLLADTSPEAVATAIIKILDDDKLQQSMSKKGYEFMKNYPIEKGFEEFLNFVNNILDDKNITDSDVRQIYNKKPIMASKEVKDAMDIIKETPVTPKNTSKSVRYMIRIKRFIKRKYTKVIRKLFRV